MRVQSHNYGDWQPPKPSEPGYEEQLATMTRWDIVSASTAALARLNEYKAPFDQMLERLRERNPNKRILRYLSLQCKPTWDRDWGLVRQETYAEVHQRQCPLDWWLVERNDWWLYDRSGEIAKETSNIWMLDVGRPGFAEAYASAVEEHWIEGYDGVVLDFDNPPTAKYTHNAGMRDYSSDQDWWERAWRPFVEHVFPRLWKLGLVILNCGGEYGVERHPYPKDSHQRGLVDGVIHEASFFGFSGERRSFARVDRLMAAMQADPLIVLQTDLLGDVWDERVRANRMTISIAGHLLAMPGGDTSGAYLRTKRYVHVATDQRPRWDNRYNLDLGEPTSSRECPAEGVWRRYYSNGLVVMNYSMVPWVTNLRGRWCDLGGVGVGGSTTIAPESALILRRV